MRAVPDLFGVCACSVSVYLWLQAFDGLLGAVAMVAGVAAFVGVSMLAESVLPDPPLPVLGRLPAVTFPCARGAVERASDGSGAVLALLIEERRSTWLLDASAAPAVEESMLIGSGILVGYQGPEDPNGGSDESVERWASSR